MTPGQHVGAVAELWRFPVKSFQGERVETADVDDHGVRGDRAWAVRDGVTGSILSAKRVPQLLTARGAAGDHGPVVELPGAGTFAGGDHGVDLALSEWLERPASLVAAAQTRASREPFFDSAGVHVLSTTSLARAAQHHPSGHWESRRFRANVVVDLAVDAPIEDEWVGCEVYVGAVVLAVTKRTVRCPMISAAQPGLAADPDVLASVSRSAEKRLGVYAEVTKRGSMRIGDMVTLVVPGRAR